MTLYNIKTGASGLWEPDAPVFIIRKALFPEKQNLQAS